MKIFVSGGSSLLGRKIAEIATIRGYEVYAGYCHNKPEFGEPIKLDLSRYGDLEVIYKIRPEIIIHTAALTNVDECETNKELAYEINVQGTRRLSEIGKELGAFVVYISTDYVFDGAKGMYREGDMTNPINHYGKTKLEGEHVVKTICEDWIIARTSVLYGWNPVKPNFVTWALDELMAGNRIRIVSDQFNSPTLADNLTDMIIKLIKRDEHGVFHTSGSERISRYDFVIKIAEIFDLNSELIEPITSDQLNWTAKRPADSSLDVSKISNIEKPLTIEESLEKMRELQ